jgi:hypothetical protein
MNRFDNISEFLINAFNYIADLYGKTFDNVQLIITESERQPSCYMYRLNEETNAIENPRVRVCIEEFNEFDDFQTRHYNSEFGTKLTHEYKIVLLRMLCHEMSHHLNIETFKYMDEEYDCALYDLERYYEYGTEERKRAYRMIPEEYAADENAAKILKKHLNNLLALYKEI